MASMTIKEAFQKLSKVTNAGIKNPWFVIRNLGQTFADVADNVVDAGGSTVEVTQVQESGTKIATITVDETSTDLYAPTPSPVSEDYSTTERVVGKWIDGETDVYEKVFTLESFTIPASGVDYWNLATGIDRLISFFGTYNLTVGQRISMNVNGFNDSNTGNSYKSYVAVYGNSNDTLAVKFAQDVGAAAVTVSDLYAVARYTKKTT